MKFHLIIAVLLSLPPVNAQEDIAQKIVDAAVLTHGADRIPHSTIDFDFRGRHFTVDHNGGVFRYERTYQDTTGLVRDILSNEEFRREVGGKSVELPERMRLGLPGSVNSVVYFALLPYKLNDPAVNKRFLGESIIKGQPYQAVEVTFEQEGGGGDWNDVFVYWFHKEHRTMDYLAYLYHVNGGGTRFREAHNIRTIEGIRIADYRNYKSESTDLPLVEYAEAFSTDTLIKVSDVDVENVRVRLRNQ